MDEVKDQGEETTQICRVRYGQLEVNFPTQLDGEKIQKQAHTSHVCTDPLPLLYAAKSVVLHFRHSDW